MRSRVLERAAREQLYKLQHTPWTLPWLVKNLRSHKLDEQWVWDVVDWYNEAT